MPSPAENAPPDKPPAMKSLAVIGTGIAGLACAYFLRNRFRVTVYEKNNYIGGHTNTVTVNEGSQDVPIDTGFMVYNERTYPNLIRFFKHLEIESMDTSMSFGVNDAERRSEISFTNLATFYPSIADLLKPARHRLLFSLKRLFDKAQAFLASGESPDATLADFIAAHGIDELATREFLLPMTAAIWSTPSDKMLDYPAQTLFRFLANHGMLGFGDPFQWKTLVGGSQQYKTKILAEIGSTVKVETGAVQLRRQGGKVSVIDSRGGQQSYDRAIVATHADQALALLESPTEKEQKLLSSFRYNVNPVVLHSDEAVMPTKRRAWASWNYRYEKNGDKMAGSTHYWMNKLQNVSKNRNYFVSVDYAGPIAADQIHWRYTYEHPRFDRAAIAAQPALPELNEEGPLHFCGSYFRYGFHEDAFTSALALSTQLNDGQDPLA